jgi:hypothetical protein
VGRAAQAGSGVTEAPDGCAPTCKCGWRRGVPPALCLLVDLWRDLLPGKPLPADVQRELARAWRNA